MIVQWLLVGNSEVGVSGLSPDEVYNYLCALHKFLFTLRVLLYTFAYSMKVQYQYIDLERHIQYLDA